jgi:nucleotide-binding universal stress UspA family protein
MTSTILLCDDGSPDAEAASNQVARLFPGAAVTVIAVWEAYDAMMMQAGYGFGFAYAQPAGDVEEIDALVEQRARAAAEAAAKRLRAAGLAADVRVAREQISVPATILAVARELDVDAIVLGTRGRGGMKSLLLGSVSHAVLQHADRPALVIPSPAIARARGDREDAGEGR